MGRKGGQIGGKRRLKTMTKEQRSKVADALDAAHFQGDRSSRHQAGAAKRQKHKGKALLRALYAVRC
jgi:hypothetical protein